MNRSPGVTAVAVFAILEGLLGCILGVLALLGVVMQQMIPRTADIPVQPTSFRVIVGLEVLLLLGVGAWSIISAIGLLRMKQWARISICVLGGILAVFSLFGVFGAVMVASMRNIIPAAAQAPELPSNFVSIMAWTMAGICLMQMSIGVWWLVFLNRRAVKEQFGVGAASTAVMPGELPVGYRKDAIEKPLSILVIGWIMAASGLTCVPFYFVGHYPALLFGMIINGWQGRLVYLVLCGLCGGIGIGLIRLNPLSLKLAVTYVIFGFLNITVTLLKPGAFKSFLEIAMKNSPQQQQILMAVLVPRIIWFAVGFGVLLNAAQLWFLITRKEAYLAAAARKQNTPIPA